MRKSYSIFLCLSLLFSITSNSSAQSNENEMFQFEQSRQFLGKWQAEAGDDTTMTVSFEPWGMAMKYTYQMIRKLNDSVTMHYDLSGIFGFTGDYKSIVFAGVDPPGYFSYDSGRFVSATKYIAEKYDGYTKDPKAIEEIVFKSPDKMLIRIKERGAKMARDAEWGPTITLIKVE